MENEELSIDTIKHLVEKVVGRYVSNRAIPVREESDVVMSVVEKFILNRSKIDRAFEGKSKITTYYIAVFNRMCCEVIRKEQKHWYTVSGHDDEVFSETNTPSFSETEKQLFIQEELKRFGFVLQTFGGEEAKIYLFVRYYYRLPVTPERVAAYCRNAPEEIYAILIEETGTNQADIFDRLARVVSLAEGKNVKGDAVRMWLHKRLDAMLNRINLNGISHHTRESLQILFEMSGL